MTTTPRFPIRLFLAAALLLSPCHLFADEKVKPEFIGLWESKKGSIYVEFAEDGKFHVVPKDAWPKVGSWKMNPKSGELTVKGRGGGEEFDGKIGVKMDGENGASFTMEGETIACTRINKKLDRKKLIRAWKSTEKAGQFFAHQVVILKANGKRLSKSLNINEGDKTYYYTHVRENEWRIVGDRLLLISRAGTKDEWSTAYGNFQFDGEVIPDEVVSYDMLVEAGTTVVEYTDGNDELPDPPEGYKKVTHDDFWRAMLEGF